MRDRVSLLLQAATVALLALLLVRLPSEAPTPTSYEPAEQLDLDRLERLMERVVSIEEHNGNQLYLICSASEAGGGLYGPDLRARPVGIHPMNESQISRG